MKEYLWREEFVRTNLFEKVCDHTFWSDESPKNNSRFQAGDIVFCKTDEVLRFFERLRLTRKRIVLVTGESDYPCDSFRQQFLPRNVAHWFATNVVDPHPLVTAIPLGLGAKKGTLTLAFSQKREIEVLTPKTKWLYVNFRVETNPGIRQKIYDTFKERAIEEPWITFEEPSPYGQNEKFLTQLKQHRFIVAPPGNGVDTHRLWEALALGTYPVALRSRALEAFEALPILFVDDYREITLPFLMANLQELERKRFNNFMLQMSHWEKEIKEAKKFLNSEKKISWGDWIAESFLYGKKMMKRRFLKYVAKN